MKERKEPPAVRSGEPFVVMAKPVGAGCNMRCSYCYYTDGGRASGGVLPAMSDDCLERFIAQYIQASPGPAVSFTWHGGEPTLSGLPFFERAVALQQKHLPLGWTCWNSLQTNGLLLDETWCAFLADHGFDVGLSIDGTQAVHDAHRRDLGGGETYARTLRAAERLLARGIRPDLMCTVTALAAREPLAVYRALREIGTGWLQFIPIVRALPGGGMGEETVSGEAFGRFLCAIFDEWLLCDMGALDVQFFAEALLALGGEDVNLCTMAPSCGRVLVVERDGSVYSCDHFVAPEHRIGDIVTSHLGGMIDSPAQRDFGARKSEGLCSRCLACRWLSSCNGGCPKDRIALTEEGEPVNWLCEGYSAFFSHAHKPLESIVALRRKGVSAQAMREGFRSMARAAWKGIGRNDPCPCGSGKKAKHCCWDRFHP